MKIGVSKNVGKKMEELKHEQIESCLIYGVQTLLRVPPYEIKNSLNESKEVHLSVHMCRRSICIM